MSTGFAFGAKTTATPTFGTGSITFGTPATQPAQQFGFGGLSSSAPSLFGTQTAPMTSNLSFKPTGFGAPTATTNTGFAFGTATPSFGNPVSSAPTTSFFGAAPASSAPSTGFGFATPAAASTGLTFGTPATTAALAFKPSASTGLSFGTPSTGTGLTFGTPASTGLGFGAPSSTGLTFGTAASSGLGFGSATSAPTATTGLSFGVSTAAPATGLSFGTTTAAPTLGLSFGTPSTTATSSGLSFGLGGVTPSSTSLGLSNTSTQQNVGLGGVTSAQSKTGTSSGTQKELPPKEQFLPNELSQLLDQFKNVVQEEKSRSTNVARCSVKEFRKVESELDALNHQFNQVENQLMNNRSLAEQLKYDTAKGLQNIEMAQHTQETPPSLQYDNTAPLQFFIDLAENFEREMQLLKLKIDNTEKFIKKCHEPSVLTSQDLAAALKRLHETFVALAGRMQSIHRQVENQKEIFLNFRKKAFKDNSNPFEKLDKSNEAMNVIMKSALNATPPTLACGPTPFNSITLGSNNLTLAAQQTQPPSYPSASTTANTSLGFGLGNTQTFGTASANNSLFKSPGLGSSPFQLNTSSNFQLQKPPIGNKRGKQ